MLKVKTHSGFHDLFLYSYYAPDIVYIIVSEWVIVV